MEAIQAAIEHACLQFENPASRQHAESILLEFRRSNECLQACQFILHHSGILQARFHAAVTLREVAIARWSLLTKANHHELRASTLQATVRHAGEGDGLVRRQLAGALAAFLKRGWDEDSPEEKQALLADVSGQQAAASMSGDAVAVRLCTGLECLDAIVAEFSPATASAMGLSWEYHERCRAGLEAHFLQSFFLHALQLAQAVAPSVPAALAPGGAATAPVVATLQAALRLAATILAWDFRQRGGMPATWHNTRPSGDIIQVKPGPAWRSILLAPQATAWLQELLAALRACHRDPCTAAARCPTEPARQLVISLAALSGDIFPKEENGAAHAAGRSALGLPPRPAATPAKDAHLARVLQMVLPWVTPPADAVHNATANSEDELLAACRALGAAAPVHRAGGFQRAGPPGLLSQLAELTCCCISAGGMDEAAEGTWPAEATEMLLEMWVELLADGALRCGGSCGAQPMDVAGDAAARVFHALVEAALRDARSGALSDEEEGEAAAGAAGDSGSAGARDEAFTRAASLGRAAPRAAAPLLAGLIDDRIAQLQRCGQANSDPSGPLEELCWLARMATHLLADPGEGETPLVPVQLAMACEAAAAGGGGGLGGVADPVEALSHRLLGVAGLCLDEAARPLISPRLMEAAVWAAARWADTYLLPTDDVSAAVGASFGRRGAGQRVLGVLVEVAGQLVVSGSAQWAGEVDLQRVVCLRLLPVLVRRAAVCGMLVGLPEWQALAGAFAAQQGPVRALSEQLQRALTQSLCTAACGLPSAADAAAYITHVMRGVAGEVVELAGRPDLAAIAERPDVLARAAGLVEALRGAARGCTPRARLTLYQLTTATMQPLLELSKAYAQQPRVTCLILKLAGDVVESHLAFLPPPAAAGLCQWVLHLLELYAAHNRGRVAVAAPARLAEEAARDAYRDLRALLRLLEALTQADLLQEPENADGSQPAAAPDLAQVVFLGLDTLIPLISLDLLKFPKLCRAYFSLLAHMLEVYPERVAGLPGPQFGALVGTLQYGVESGDADVTQASLEALAALARFHASSLKEGGQGLGPRNAAGAGGVSVLGCFLQALTRRLLAEELGPDSVDLAADALLPLIVAEPGVFQHIGESLLAGQAADPHAQATLTHALNQLTTANGVSITSLDRTNRKRFRTNLAHFVAEARGVVRTR